MSAGDSLHELTRVCERMTLFYYFNTLNGDDFGDCDGCGETSDWGDRSVYAALPVSTFLAVASIA